MDKVSGTSGSPAQLPFRVWLGGVFLHQDLEGSEAGGWAGLSYSCCSQLVWSQLTPPDLVAFSPAVAPQSGHTSLPEMQWPTRDFRSLGSVKGCQDALTGPDRRVPPRTGCRGPRAHWPLTPGASPGEERGSWNISQPLQCRFREEPWGRRAWKLPSAEKKRQWPGGTTPHKWESPSPLWQKFCVHHKHEKAREV